MLEKIKSEIEKKGMETGSEDVSIIMKVTEGEKQKFLEECDNLNEHWNWDLFENELHVNYKAKKQSTKD